MKVLICDDNADFRRSLAPMLEGTELVQADSLASAIAAAPGVDIVLLDLNMPDSGGVGTLDAFLERVPDVPVIVVTGDLDEIGEESVRHGAQDFFIKTEISAKALDKSLAFAVARFLRKRLDDETRQRKEAEETIVTVRPIVDALGELVAKLRSHLPDET